MCNTSLQIVTDTALILSPFGNKQISGAQGRERSMSSNEDLRSILRHLRLIASTCPDLTTWGRLRWLGDQIEQQVQSPSVILTTLNDPENQSGAAHF
jgi:hypothetical protein